MSQNTLFPVFLKLDSIQTLLVGGGNVALEKLTALINNCHEARVTVVADYICEEIKGLAEASSGNIRLLTRKFFTNDLDHADLLILATDNPSLHQRIKAEARSRRILTNVADTPELCDFYLGSVVQKGDLKIGISTNGKSPTFAKRFREFLEENIPEGIQELLDNLNNFRNQLKGDFQYKVKTLNELTASLTVTEPKKS